MVNQERYSIHELAKAAGISTRTLHFYDKKGVLVPDARKENGYRVYSHASLLRLQQILFLRELGFNLRQIKSLLDQPDFDLQNALRVRESELLSEIDRLNLLIDTIKKTLKNLNGELEMKPKEYFRGISGEKQKEYQEYIKNRYNAELVDESNRSYAQLNESEKQELLENGNRITAEIVASIPFGPSSKQAQAAVEKWYGHINHFYNCSLDMFKGLGQLYSEHSDFKANYRTIDPAMPEFLTEAINIYCMDHRLD